MGSTASKVAPPPPRTKPGERFTGKPRLCMVGMAPSHNVANAKRVFDALTDDGTYDTWWACFKRTGLLPWQKKEGPYYDWVEELKKELPPEQQTKFGGRHGWSAPFVWWEMPDGTRSALGGRDAFCEWAMKQYPPESELHRLASTAPKSSEAYSVSQRPGSVQG